MSPFDVDPAWEHDPAALAEPPASSREYFAGERTEFELELRPAGTGFQRSVWDLLLAIPYGETTTYGALAPRSATRARCARSGWRTAATRSRSSCRATA